ncbi:hypothetical protein Hdeb2414_s0024g00648121 [Helianthus debilis subsp. tardiflorus]
MVPRPRLPTMPTRFLLFLLPNSYNLPQALAPMAPHNIWPNKLHLTLRNI